MCVYATCISMCVYVCGERYVCVTEGGGGGGRRAEYIYLGAVWVASFSGSGGHREEEGTEGRERAALGVPIY